MPASKAKEVNEMEIRRTVESDIQTAFRGVTLGQGMSLRQAQLADRSQDAVRNPHSASVAPREVVDD